MACVKQVYEIMFKSEPWADNPRQIIIVWILSEVQLAAVKEV